MQAEQANQQADKRSFWKQATDRWSGAYRNGGPAYAVLYAGRWLIDNLSERLDRKLVSIEQGKGLVAPWTVSARRFTSADNKIQWNTYDWTKLGEEWTRSAEWKQQLLNRFLLPNIPAGSTVLEVGPGGGRWTEHLLERCARVYVVDVSERVLQVCRERFSQANNIEFLLTGGHNLDVADGSIDVVWSYDVFVHINPNDTRGYFEEFRRVLRPGGQAVIHHPGMPDPAAKVRTGWRSDTTERQVLSFAAEMGLSVVSQTRELVNTGDVLTIFANGAAAPADPRGRGPQTSAGAAH
jgi:ubiquinone/menaquinone biosynthesis C-methylase UbiE